ncbi:hypothetical protein SDRG_13067 [Saprolegnia diclina VS20]|uniref:Leucine-rich repeat-containing N-terminal plant-type domain-containing protein n=1 Tax=Saprolegnia diclina (strain VS20) TaxID=1156394 RepID=T0PUJ7_SAPDV|nr:hypothetical protein SDRG_13067 [Saprolegnia diclina VS20]EQC29194.1 hypothetical protein SDRG_13067 [Saprolegnia diclina VS20]|eukprot:XP_008617372.1 hypothetical protein SDRG_13067 [Saprolegnia diclina VS20]
MRRLWALLGLASGVVAAASCPYTSLGGSAVLASDTNCGSDAWCLLSPGNCSRLSYTYFASTDSFWDVQAIGDLTNYVKDGLFVQSAPLALDLSQMVLPSALQRLYSVRLLSHACCIAQLRRRLRNVASLSLSQITSPWPALTCLELINCNLVRFSSSFAFPPGLKSLYITKNMLVRVPSNLPASIRKLGLQGNAITSLNGLPPTVINLDASFNQLTDVSNVDWRAVTSVDLSNNPLTALANVRLASRLTYFNIANCSIVNVTIDAETFNALDALAPSSALKDDRGYYRYDPDNNVIYVGYKVTSTIYTDTAACEANHGSIRELWATTSEYDVRI